MSHFFFIEEDQVPKLEELIKNKVHNEYFVLARSNGFADIAQFSDKFQNLKIITVRENQLDRKRELK